MKWLFSVLMILPTLLSAQKWQKIDSVFSPSGVIVSSFSSPAFADLNNDGQLDLLLGNISGEMKIFTNKNYGYPPQYFQDTSLTASIYAGGQQGTNSDYPVSIDLDGDLDYDLVISGYNGLLYYENIGTVNSAVWGKVDTLLFYDVNQLIGTDAKPAFADLDADGDYDLVVGIGESLFGGPEPGILMGFRNNGTASNPSFVEDNSLVAGLPDVGRNAYPVFGDLDADGDYEILIGRDLHNFVYYRNDGDSTAPSWTLNNGLFAGLGSSTYWNNPALADLDNDEDLDLVYGISDGKLFYYENIGTKYSPSYQYNSNYFPIIKLDGGGATVSLADFDGDGDYDLLSGDWYGKLQYFENTGNENQADFVKTSAPFTSITLSSSYSMPRFLDIDNDNDLDIISGALNGKMFPYINNGSSFTLNSSLFSNIDLYGRSAPAFADIDGDGDIDMLLGSDDAASIGFYENDGSNNFTLNNSFIAGITFSSYSFPTFTDLDNDGDYDLAIGRISGKINFYKNIGNASSPQWQVMNDVFEGIEVKQSAFIDFADLDNDGLKDMIIGEYDGNFTFYKNLSALTSVKSDEKLIADEFELSQNYPNPFNPITKIKYKVPSKVKGEMSNVKINIYDILGNQIATLVNEQKAPGNYEVEFDGVNLSSGIYFYELRSGEILLTKKMILLK
ncbi:MAG: T9SS type A sorting domain-containing protein [Ignavibacteriae bacterium]|nr:T9SS C-terminal target domain-containing protein [Ignavibacteriota bacterium]NOG97684.1 T9SS type A sorting domain-containing protein [Ignavibacteriota bacterium]